MHTFKLQNQDCFEFLKTIEDNSIDLVLIDPPYEISRETGFQYGEAKGKDTDRFRVSMDFGEWDNKFTGLDKIIKECYRVLKNSGTLICFYDLWKLTILRPMNILTSPTFTLNPHNLTRSNTIIPHNF